MTNIKLLFAVNFCILLCMCFGMHILEFERPRQTYQQNISFPSYFQNPMCNTLRWSALLDLDLLAVEWPCKIPHNCPL